MDACYERWWSLEWNVFLFSFSSFPNIRCSLLNIARLSHSDAFLQFSTGVEYLLYLRNLYKFVCSFFLFFAFLCPSEHRFLAYVCLHRDILPVCSPYDNVRASFIVFASFLLSWRRFYRFGVVFIIILRISFANFTFLFCFRAYCERCGGKLR